MRLARVTPVYLQRQFEGERLIDHTARITSIPYHVTSCGIGIVELI
jgi:hypothetical protein